MCITEESSNKVSRATAAKGHRANTSRQNIKNHNKILGGWLLSGSSRAATQLMVDNCSLFVSPILETPAFMRILSVTSNSLLILLLL